MGQVLSFCMRNVDAIAMIAVVGVCVLLAATAFDLSTPAQRKALYKLFTGSSG